MTAELITKCFEVENWTRSLTMRGMDREEIVYKIDEMYEPETLDEMEAYSEAILYARLGVLNQFGWQSLDRRFKYYKKLK